ncbi:integrase [Pseudomonas aeruginosa]|uniref:tyrosine-type recombinase/integrase n=1 Tax=Pseudomonas aeruginosa TaxID=287 RepID=UPI000FFEF0D7|nr:tyrosine-type recombinase/integrase [Pseudomonas aeruginosa]MBG4604253.1 tyrosine-type recombinase/integrase [Pseudomonas aeruginosa]MBH8258771.1 tyrosine-type recombinase/integrase [Pseudomonas aeruginosa]MCV3909321.1 tyrosine-type recombinase/integrase [Pseudomonas aeruginosa]RRS17057.1 integrase [Pseudomonas aeruginosa]RRS19484.1 integrase [Pseudomonas aeruginosa]
MAIGNEKPFPLFDSYSEFIKLNFNDLSKERPIVIDLLRQADQSADPVDSYLVVRDFLHSYDGNEGTFNSYRTHAERLLLWCMLVAKLPILSMRRTEAEAFMEFCMRPPAHWVGPVVKSRYVRLGGRKKAPSDTYVINEAWRPFNLTQPKVVRKLAEEANVDAPAPQAYKMSSASTAQVFAACQSFFQFCIDEDRTDANPFRAIKQKSRFTQRETREKGSRSLNPLQWDFVIETAELMAEEDAEHERTLFILVTLFSLYLRISDLVGRDNWEPTMGSFQKQGDDWWFHAIRKGNKKAKVSVRSDYLRYLKRYRATLALSPLPFPGETTPLLRTLNGRAGLSDRHVRELIQGVFDRAVERMKAEGQPEDEITNLRASSLHWLRHTSATFDAPFRDMKDLQADLGHESLSTTQDNYYDSLDGKRASSVKDLLVKGH